MKKLFLTTLLTLVATVAPMSAQNEQTAEPLIVLQPWAEEMSFHPNDSVLERFIHFYYFNVSFENADDSEAVIYFRTVRDDGTSEWQEYETMITFWDYGAYKIEAYAQADGKLPSNIRSAQFDITDYYLYSVFIINGVYYKTTDNSSASVASAAEWSSNFGY